MEALHVGEELLQNDNHWSCIIVEGRPTQKCLHMCVNTIDTVGHSEALAE